MRRSISWLVSAAETKQVYEKRFKKKVNWRINFITLTIPNQNGIDDRKVKRILNAWLKYCKYSHGLNNYVWKAEVQARGEIHFHIISDCYIHHTTIRMSWNRLLKKHNLLGNHDNPNSTDVHAVIENGINDLTAYAVDYMQKKEKNEDGSQKRTIKGRLWGCSRKLSKAGKTFMLIEEDDAKLIHQLFKDSNWKSLNIENCPATIYMPTQRGDIYRYINKDDDIYKLYKQELEVIKSHSIQLPLFERHQTLRQT